MDCSLHNYGLAVDIDPFGHGNDHFHRPFGDKWDFSDIRLTRSQVEAVEALKTRSGARLFRWLGWDIGDSMHFQIDCTEADLSSGIVGQEDVMTPEQEAKLDKVLAALPKLDEALRAIEKLPIGVWAAQPSGNDEKSAFQTILRAKRNTDKILDLLPPG